MRILSIALLGLSTSLAQTAVAQQTCNGGASCPLNVSATATINSVARLSISSTTTTLTTPAVSDFGSAAGVNSTGPTLTVKSNAGYTLTASAASGTWSGGNNNKLASDLKMTVNGGSVTALGQVGQSANATSGTTFTMGYNTIYSFTVDAPGSYSLVVKYTLSAP
jgi:hypothetical protein